jgi:hypothetical protein
VYKKSKGQADLAEVILVLRAIEAGKGKTVKK